MTNFFVAPHAKDDYGFNIIRGNDCRDIHLATLQVLENTGVFVEDPKAQALFEDNGAQVDRKKGVVKLPANIIEDAIRSAPAKVRLQGRKPECDILLEEGRSAFINFPGNINVVDPYSGKIRKSTKADVAAAARLCDALEEIDVHTRAVYALDQPPAVMHIHTAEACLNHTTKHSFHGSQNKWELEKIMDMVTAAVGGAENLKTCKPVSFAAAVSSPLKLTQKTCEIIMASADAGFCTVIGNMVMAGGTGPVNLAGVAVQTNAEILSGIALAQLVCKGAPVIYASFATGMDLKRGTTPLGSPETAMLGAALARLCRYYQIPCQAPGIISDGMQSGSQAAHEKTITGMSAAMAGAHLITGIGGLDSGLTFDFAQAVLDCEMVRMIKHLKQGFPVNTETLSADLIHEIGPFGNFLSHDSTFLNMKSLSQTDLFNRSNREDWESRGKPKSYDSAMSRAIDLLENHKPEPLPLSAAEQIRAIVKDAEKEASLTGRK